MNTLIHREQIKKRFIAYTSEYDLSDPKIKLKYAHTFRVAKLCEQIAGSLHLQQDACDLAWLMGMLHDIGRFEQVRRYGTFSDEDSIDHAQFGADLLFQEGLFDEYIKRPADVNIDIESGTKDLEGRSYNADEVYIKLRNLTETAIRNHSAYRIAEGLSDEETMYCNILRDADKIDILRVNYETPIEDIYNVTTEQLKKDAVSERVKEAFKERHAVLRAYKETTVDHVVGHISLTFELVYPISRQIVKEQGYLDKVLHFESDNQETNEWFAYMRKHIWEA